MVAEIPARRGSPEVWRASSPNVRLASGLSVMVCGDIRNVSWCGRRASPIVVFSVRLSDLRRSSAVKVLVMEPISTGECSVKPKPAARVALGVTQSAVIWWVPVLAFACKTLASSGSPVCLLESLSASRRYVTRAVIASRLVMMRAAVAPRK